ncbi:MAG: molybdate ABC transporter substrate-binding protein [Rhodothermales bacterium]
MKPGRAFLLTLLLAGGSAACRTTPSTQSPVPQQEIVVFAAASLTDVLEALANSFETSHPGYKVTLSTAASSLLARQIEQGAPADVFFSANRAWTQYLADRGETSGTTREVARNRLVVVGPPAAPRLQSLSDLKSVKRLALADPAHVPAGIYAKQGLTCAGLWKELEPNVVPVLDVRAALLAARSGAAEAALVYASDVQADLNVRVLLAWPSACAPDIRYTAARLRSAPHPEAAASFLRFATDSDQAALWRRFGFLPAAPDGSNLLSHDDLDAG